jgi:hypothetical protein
LDFSVFNKPIQDIENGYISYLKSLVSSSLSYLPDESDFSIYPNPLAENSTISVKINRNEHVSLSVYSVSGQKIQTIADQNLSPGDYNFQIDRRIFVPGLYFLCLSTPTVSKNLKFVIAD